MPHHPDRAPGAAHAAAFSVFPELPPALHTPLVDMLGCRVPVLSAGMGGVARHELAAAVSNAGGFGCLGMVREPVALIRREVEACRRATVLPFAVNLIPAATDTALLREQVAACLELGVSAFVLFWDVDAGLVRHLKAEGALVLHQVGTRRAAEAALQAGADALIAQGVEAGGHVHGQTSTLALLPEIVALSPVPVVASGGIASGSALVAALAMGAQGVSCGSAFLATEESWAHRHHKERLLAAGAGGTVFTTQFFRNWPMPAPVRVLENAVTRGEYDSLLAERQTPVIAHQDGGPVHLFATDSPLRDATGQLDDMPIYAGQSCGQIHDLPSAAARVQQLVAEAAACLERLGAAPGRAPVTRRAEPDAGKVSVWRQLLEELMAAERAGAKVAAMSLREAQEPALRRQLQVLHRNEAESCRRLRACHERLGLEPGHRTGDFYEKAMAIPELDRRLDFIARGQRWVARRIRECLPDCHDAVLREELEIVLGLHEGA